MALNYLNFGANGVSANANFFMFAAKTTPWNNEAVPDQACNSVQELTYKTFDEMIFAKYVPPSNVNLMAARYDWVANTVYAQYDDQDEELFTKNFYVVTSESGSYHVWKCLSNDNGKPSTSQPLLSQTAESAEYYATSDGYQWKYLYSIPSAYYTSFATPSYIPVLPNANVAVFAANGGLETFLVVGGGNNYNSYTSGYFSGLQLAGNSQIYAIQSSETLNITLSQTSNTFTIGETIFQASSNATATVIGQSNNVLTTEPIGGAFDVNSAILGLTSNVYALPTAFAASGISSNNNFYTGSTLYLESGTGAGQLRLITDYEVVGTQRIVTLESAFDIAPDFTSNYSIAPTVNIIGDGVDAQAISIINPVSNSVSSIQIINRGSGYTFANVSVVGNTGFSSNTFTAVANVRPIISPVGGHGSNVVAEIHGTRIGFSTSFVNDEGGLIPANTTYRKIGIISNPTFANVTLTIQNLSGAYTVNENVTQYAPQQTIDSITRNYTNQFNYVIGNFVNLDVANTSSFPANSVITQPTTLSSGIVLTSSNTTLLVRTDTGVFSNSFPIYLGNTTTNTTISYVSQGFTNNVFGFDGSNNIFTMSTNSYIQVFLNSKPVEPAALLRANTTFPTYSANSTVVSFQNYALKTSDIISIKEYTETVILSNTEVVCTGTVVSANTTGVRLTNVNSYFLPNLPLYGDSSGATSNVVTTSQNDILDYRTTLTAAYTSGSANLVLGDLMYQGNAVFGYVTSISPVGNSFYVGLTGVKGSFEVSSNNAPKYITSADASKQLQVTGIKLPDMVKYSGTINYFENCIAVQRSAIQTETIRIIVSG